MIAKKLVFLGFALGSLIAQGTWQWSGRTHPELKWHTLKTEHFNIHYHEGIEEIAHQGASISEQVLPTLMTQMGVKDIPVIDITYTSEDEITNGYAMYTNMVFIWVDQNDVAVWLEHDKWLYQVTAHELQHIVLLHAIKSWIPEPFGLLFSRIPGWFIEGAAEYYTEKWRPYRADLSHKWHVLKQKEHEMDPHHDGFSKLLYLSEQFGDSVFIDIVKHRNKLGLFDFKKGFKKATGLTVKQFNEDWRRHMDTYYYGYRAQKERIRDIGVPFSLPVKSLRNLSFSSDSLQVAIHGRISEDQRDHSMIILSHDSSAFHEKASLTNLLVSKGTKKKPRVKWISDEIDHGRFHTSISWSPDGQKIAYSKYHYGDHQSLEWDICIYDLVTERKRWITDSFRATYPVWSPDGMSIVFVAHQNSTANLYIVDVSSDSIHQLTDFSDETYVLTPAYSPDGKSVAFAKSNFDGNTDLYLLDLSSHLIQRVTENPSVDYLPVWHPWEEKIAFTSHRGSTPNIHSVDLISGKTHQITDVGDAVWSAQWMPKDSVLIATTLGDVDSVRLMKIDPDRQPDIRPLAIRNTFSSWRTQPVTHPLPAPDKTWPVTIQSDTPYTFRKHIKHLTSFVYPLDHFEGMTVWTDAMGRHIFNGLVLSTWDFKNPSYVFSYTNAATGPLWGVDMINLLDFQYSTFENKALWESRNGLRFWMLQPFNFGESTSANHLFFGSVRLHKRIPYPLGDYSELPEPESGKEGLITFTYTYSNHRPFKSNVDLPKQGWGLRGSGSLASESLYGSFSYLRSKLDGYVNIAAGNAAVFLRGRYAQIHGSNIPGQEVVGLTNDWTLYFPGQMGALLGPESMNPRGWDGIRLGERAFLSMAEYRFPILKPLPVFNVLGMSTGKLTGALFAEAGNAWSKDRPAQRFIATAGYEVRLAFTFARAPIVILSYGSGQKLSEWENGETPKNYLQFALINPF